ncbi:MAG: hypothetical protein K1X67_12315 [Fimbriimonadaceae bacterium]|nr:hypothetical protein [Fimbriimonadaceae bacterium]
MADAAATVRRALGPGKPFLSFPWSVECWDMNLTAIREPQRLKYELWVRRMWCRANCSALEYDIGGLHQDGALVGRTYWFKDKAKAAGFKLKFG